MESKICSKCKQDFPTTSEFFPKHPKTKDGLQSWCRSCASKNAKEWREKNKNSNQTWRKQHPEYNKEWRKKNPDYAKKWKRDNPKKHKKHQSKYRKKRYHQDLVFHLRANMSSRISTALQKQGSSKNGNSWKSIVGYTIKDLMKHLEKQFTNGMNWDNYGKWHIDHIRPITSFEDNEFQECWKLNNLQPLWAKDNIQKSNKFQKDNA